MSNEIRIYVAGLAAYNNGIRHCVWIDACNELDDIQEVVNQLLKNSLEEDAAEYAIPDFEGYGRYRLSEYQGLESAHEIACFIEEHGEIASELLNQFGGDLEDATKAIEENYAGCYKSLADYAEELTEGTTDIPERPAYYIDYERMGGDMELSGDIFTIETGFERVYGYPMSHVEIKTVKPELAPLPVSDTGYRSMHIAMPEIGKLCSVKTLLLDYLDDAANKMVWKEAEVNARQFQLF